jgi:O-antigen ligase
VADRLTFNHGASAFSPRLVGRHERGGRVRSRDVTDAWPGPGTAARADLSRALARAERADVSYWGLFAFTALLFVRPQDTLPQLEPLHLPEIAAVIALIAMAVRRAHLGLPPVPAPAAVAPLAAFGATMLATVPFSIWPSGALSIFTELFLKVVLVFMLLAHSLSSPRLLRQFTWLIVAVMGYIAARGWIDYATGTNLLQGERLQGTNAGLMGNPNDLAMNMVTFLPFAAFAALTPGKTMARLFAAGVTLLMLGTIFFAKSRGGFLALAVTGLMIVLQAGRLLPGLAIASLLAALAAAPIMPQSFWTRVSSIVNPEDDDTGSRGARVTLLQDGWNAFLEHPFTGVGAGQFQNYNPPDRQELWRETHNVELQVLAELGLVGFGVFMWLLVRSANTLFRTWNVLRPRRRKGGAALADSGFAPHEREWMRSHIAACVAAFAGWLVCAQFGSIGYHWTLYYLVGLSVAAHEIVIRRTAWARGGVAHGASPA